MLGALISGGLSLLAGSKAANAQKAANRQAARSAARAAAVEQSRYDVDLAFRKREAARQQAAFDKNIALQEKWARKNLEVQETFAKEGLRWRVADAKAAGVHPLYALGANVSSSNPVHVGGSDPGGVGGPGYAAPPTFAPGAVTADADALASAGQDIGRAIAAMQTPQERMADMLKMQNMGLQNELLKAQIAQSRAGTGPGMPAWAGPDQKPMVIAGAKIWGNPDWSPAELIQNNWGEPAEWPYALFKIPGDLGYNAGQYIRREWLGGRRIRDFF